jgi:hypothetical protein
VERVVTIPQPVLTPTPRYAVLSPYVAQWLLRQAGVSARKSREQAAWLRSVGRPDLAEQFAAGVSQLLLSAAEHRATVKGAGSDVGSDVGTAVRGLSTSRAPVGTAEPVGLRSEAVSVVEEITCEAAAMLGVSEGMVRRWCRAEVLAARQPHPRSWLVERGSAVYLLEARRSA